MAVTIRALQPGEWESFRGFWLAQREEFPDLFAGAQANSPATVWQTVIQGPAHQMFGLFEDAALIGITAAFARREDAKGQTVIFGMSFILPAWRGRGLSRLLYDARLAWARERPQFRRVLLSHAESNKASRRAHRRYGFVLTDRVLQAGPDGKPEHEEYYEMALG